MKEDRCHAAQGRRPLLDGSSDPSQSELMEAVKEGDHEALAQLYDLFERPVYSVALRTVTDRQRAEEVVQDTFVKVWRGATRFDDKKGSVGAWIFTIAKRSAIDVLRREEHAPVPTETMPEATTHDQAIDELWMTWEVNLALGALPEDQRAAVDLFVIAGYTHAEVADRLGVPLGTVKTRIYSGLKRLRTKLVEIELVEASQ